MNQQIRNVIEKNITVSIFPNGYVKLLIKIFSLAISWWLNQSIWYGIVAWLLAPYYIVYKVLGGCFRNTAILDMFNFYFN